jgi:putative DNA primase/helicase
MRAATIAGALPGSIRRGKSYLIRCPVPSHGKGRGDRAPSLSVADGDNGKLLVRCFAGCESRDVLAALKQRGLLDDRQRV